MFQITADYREVVVDDGNTTRGWAMEGMTTVRKIM